MKRKIIITAFIGIIGIILVVVGILMVANKKREIASLPAPKINVPTVEVVPVYYGELRLSSRYLGQIEPVIKTELSARVTGQIINITKREGDPIKEEELLITIDARELSERAEAIQAEISATQEKLVGAESNYELQKSIYERDTTLFQAGAISKEALERSETNLKNAISAVNAIKDSITGLKRNYAAAKIQLEYSRIYAPYNGIVTKRYNDPGDLAVPGKPILSMQKNGSYKVSVQIPQEQLATLKIGNQVLLTNGTETEVSKITRIYPALDNKNLLGTVEIELRSLPFHLPVGSVVGVELSTKVVQGIIIPINALVKNMTSVYLYTIKENPAGNVVSILPIQLLGESDGKAAVSGNLNEGNLVIIGQENKLLSLSNEQLVNIFKKRE